MKKLFIYVRKNKEKTVDTKSEDLKTLFVTIRKGGVLRLTNCRNNMRISIKGNFKNQGSIRLLRPGQKDSELMVVVPHVLTHGGKYR
ncbi:TPA: hypothetical protein DEB29_03610 [Candidatus Wolfebacteria bacterium]|nr:hypothetical protein [Candidatus Wolfebacteria bacterium]